MTANDIRCYITENETDAGSKKIAVKDNIAVSGMKLTCGSLALENYVCPYNAHAVQKLIDAGYVICGKTNLDEFGMGNTGEKSAFMKTLNPKYPDLTTGGSSAGSAAAVAAGLCDCALGTDTGGSVRVPAACCGIYGFKPTYNAVSRFGLVAYASSMDVIGILSNTADSISEIFDVIRETEKKEIKKNPVIKDYIFNNTEEMLEAYFAVISYEAHSNLNRFDGVRYGKSGRTYFGPVVKERIIPCDRERYEEALKFRAKLISEIEEVFEDADIIRFPALSDGPDDNWNVYANLTGLPAIVIPTGKMQAVELMAKRGCDDLLIYAAKEGLI